MKAVLTLIGGIVIGIAIAHFAFGPIDWSNVRDQTGAAVTEAATVTAVRTALALQKDFELFGDISVSVEDGVVTLAGRVATVEQRQLAELISRGVHGVSRVDNELQVNDTEEAAGETNQEGHDSRRRP